MKITLRSKPVANGSRSLFLEYYEKGKRTYEFLRLYLVPEIDEQSKKENENALQKAYAIKAERTICPNSLSPDTPIGFSGEGREKKKITLIDWVDQYRKLLINNGTYSKAAIDQTSTIKESLIQYLASINSPGILLSKIDKCFVKGYLMFLTDGYVQSHWKTENKPLSNSTKKAYQTKFNTILNKAVREGLITANPFYQLEKQDIYHSSITAREYLTIDEVKRFLDVKTDGKETQRAFVFACFTGLRISDIRALKWSDIHNSEASPTIVMEQEKTQTVVRVPLGKTALSLLPEKHDGTKVFKLPTATAVHLSCKWIAEHAGITKNVSFHTARHTFATLTLSACEDLELVSKLLGHKSIKTTQRYAEVLLSNKMEAVKRIDNVFT